jgi:hypothetical protein
MKLMKKIILLAAWCACSLAAAAQDYLPLLQDGRYWSIRKDACDEDQYRRLEAAGDTVIADIAYKVLHNCTIFEEDKVHGFARADSANSKLWLLDPGGTETLIMDLDLAPGDFFPELGAYVSHIDTIDGRKTITFEAHYVGYCVVGPEAEPLRFIEGVGPNSGWPREAYDGVSYFIDCVGEGEEVLYAYTGIPWWGNWCPPNCVVDTVPIGVQPELQAATADLEISPSGVTLLSDSPHPHLLRIFDPLGRALQTHDIFPGMTIPWRGLPAGWYVLGLYDRKGGLVLSRKVPMPQNR